MGCPASLERTHRVLLRPAGLHPDVLLVVRRDWEDALPVEALLAGADLSRWGAPARHDLAGRDRVEVLDTPRGQIVAKRLSRGGVIGALWRRTYFDPWRPAREAELAERLAARGCPTPPVVAARSRRTGPRGWALELATARVAGAVDLLAALQAAAGASHAPERLWALLGQAGAGLRRLHDAGLLHRDLQLKNLLVPRPAGDGGPRPEGLVVLDLDRCRLDGPLDLPQRLTALARLGRSAVKAGLLPGSGPGRLPPGSVERFFAAYGAWEGHAPEDLAAGAAAALARRLRWSGGGAACCGAPRGVPRGVPPD